MVNDVLSLHAFRQPWAESLEGAVHTARGFTLPPRRQQLLRDQLMVAALIGTLTGPSLDGGTSGIFLRVRLTSPAFGSIEMFSTAWDSKLAALLEIYGSFDFVIRMAIEALILSNAIIHLVN